MVWWRIVIVYNTAHIDRFFLAICVCLIGGAGVLGLVVFFTLNAYLYSKEHSVLCSESKDIMGQLVMTPKLFFG